MGILIFFLLSMPLSAQVVITEIMYNLPGTDSPNEFVELYNLSATDTVNFTGWTICDAYSCDDLMDFGRGMLLPPQTYGLVMESDYDTTNGIYHILIPASTLLITTDDLSIGNGLSASDLLIVHAASGTVVDSVAWDDWAAEGYSLEKIDLVAENEPGNWAMSKDSLGTPGMENSVTPFLVDGALLADSIRWLPTRPAEYELLSLYIPVTNRGLSDFTVHVSIWLDEAILAGFQGGTISSGDTTIAAVDLTGLPSGRHTLTVILEIPTDEDLTDNAAQINLDISYPRETVQLNEFLAQPEINQSEFIEVVTNRAITTSGWSIADNTGNCAMLPNAAFAGGNYLVIARDSSILNNSGAINLLVPSGWPALNNSGDGIFIFDHTGMLLDSLQYDESWKLLESRSQEKLRPELASADRHNWSPAVNSAGQTPGQPNSIFIPEPSGQGLLKCYPNPFSPDNNGHEDQLNIHFILPFDIGLLKIEIFDMVGRRVATPCWNVVVAGEGLQTWDGRNNDGDAIPIGLYILKLSAVDQNSGKSWEKVKPVVVARKL